MEIEKWLETHLENYIQHSVAPDSQDAFRAYALSRIEADMDYWLNVGWSTLYGQFLDYSSSGWHKKEDSKK